MSRTIEILQKYAAEGIRTLSPTLDERGASRMLEVHLHPVNFPMPLRSVERERELVQFCRGDAPVADAHGLLAFEDTRSMIGIAGDGAHAPQSQRCRGCHAGCCEE